LVARSCPVRRLLAFRSFTSRDWIGRPIPAGRARQGLGQAPNLRDIFEAGEINIASHACASLTGISWTRPGRTHCFGGLPRSEKPMAGVGAWAYRRGLWTTAARSSASGFCRTARGRPIWRVRAGVARPELFLERESFGKRWHFSLHASGRWHMKEGGQERISWARPDEVVPGYTRAVGIVQPVAVAHRDDAAPEGVELVTVPPQAKPTTFSVFMERPGANMNGWPGKNAMGTVFVGRIPLAGDTGTCCIVARQEPLEPGEMALLRPSDTELARMREVAARGTLLTTVIGSLSDGAIALIDLRAARDAFAPVDPEEVSRSGG